MIITDEQTIYQESGVRREGDKLVLHDEEILRVHIEDFVDTVVLGSDPQIRGQCMWVIHEAALQMGIYPASMHGFYMQRARDEALTFCTVPAINLRTLTFFQASAIFRVAHKYNAGAFVFEIAQSEISYTRQTPCEYTALLLAAAIKERYTGPVFIQADHTQVNAKEYAVAPTREMQRLKQAIDEALKAGFYNIDIDSSTVVDLRTTDIDKQQRLNYRVCAELTKYIRNKQPSGVTVSIGGEIGEVGGKNSSVAEVDAFMRGFKKEVGKVEGISKLSIQTGTTHGGVVLPDGTIANVNIDFETIRELSMIARKKYGLAGCVQHGASTLPHEAFHKFPEVGCCEIHLATQFQNIVYGYMPIPLKEKMYEWVKENCTNEHKPGLSEEQFIYTTRKKALGPFKNEIHRLPRAVKHTITAVLEEEFDFLFNQLKVRDTRPSVMKYTQETKVSHPWSFCMQEIQRKQDPPSGAD